MQISAEYITDRPQKVFLKLNKRFHIMSNGFDKYIYIMSICLDNMDKFVGPEIKQNIVLPK